MSEIMPTGLDRLVASNLELQADVLALTAENKRLREAWQEVYDRMCDPASWPMNIGRGEVNDFLQWVARKATAALTEREKE